MDFWVQGQPGLQSKGQLQIHRETLSKNQDPFVIGCFIRGLHTLVHILLAHSGEWSHSEAPLFTSDLLWAWLVCWPSSWQSCRRCWANQAGSVSAHQLSALMYFSRVGEWFLWHYHDTAAVLFDCPALAPCLWASSGGFLLEAAL